MDRQTARGMINAPTGLPSRHSSPPSGPPSRPPSLPPVSPTFLTAAASCLLAMKTSPSSCVTSYDSLQHHPVTHPRESQPPGGQPSRQTPTNPARPTTTRCACSGQLRRRHSWTGLPAVKGCRAGGGLWQWWCAVWGMLLCLSDLPGVHDGDGGQALLLVHHREAQRARVNREHALERLHARQDSQQATHPAFIRQPTSDGFGQCVGRCLPTSV